MRKSTIASTIILFTFGTISLAAPTKKNILSTSIDLKKLEDKYASAGSLEADFVQEVYQATLARTKSSKGIIMLSKPNYVRWETHEPERSVLVSNGRKLWYYTPNAGGKNKGQVIVRPASTLTSNALVGILNGTIRIEKEFTLKESTPVEKADEISIVLLPKHSMADIQSVTLVVDAKYLIQELKLAHLSGNQTKIHLQKIRLGSKLPTNLFKFAPPPEAEVVIGP